jgi:hypothetical protein
MLCRADYDVMRYFWQNKVYFSSVMYSSKKMWSLVSFLFLWTGKNQTVPVKFYGVCYKSIEMLYGISMDVNTLSHSLPLTFVRRKLLGYNARKKKRHYICVQSSYSIFPMYELSEVPLGKTLYVLYYRYTAHAVQYNITPYRKYPHFF